MNKPLIDLIGVYRLDDDDIDYEYYGEVFNPQNAQNVYLVEMLIRKPLTEVSIGEITQESDLPLGYRQAPYDEVFLNEQGTEVISEKGITSPFRLAFFFHYLDFEKPMKTPFGDVVLPSCPDNGIPSRLKGKIKYVEP